MRSDNSSGIKGVHFNKLMKKWQARIMHNGKTINLGFFDNIEDAKETRVKKAKEIFGEYINKCEL